MLRIAPNAPRGQITVRHTEPSPQQRREMDRRKRLSSLATPKGLPVPLRQLPWPLFLAKLEHKRDLAVRAHIRWAMRSAIRTCETLRRSEGRHYELRPGGRGNIVASGGMYHRHDRSPDGAGERMPGLDSKIIYQSSRYVAELEENLRKYLCPEWAIPVVKRAIRAKLALGWDLDFDEEVA